MTWLIYSSDYAIRMATRPFLAPGQRRFTAWVLVGIDADNGQVLDGHALVAHVTGHLNALEDARAR